MRINTGRMITPMDTTKQDSFTDCRTQTEHNITVVWTNERRCILHKKIYQTGLSNLYRNSIILSQSCQGCNRMNLMINKAKATPNVVEYDTICLHVSSDILCEPSKINRYTNISFLYSWLCSVQLEQNHRDCQHIDYP